MSAGTLKENNTCSGMRRNIVFTLAYLDRLAERLNRKIELPGKRITVVEHGKNSEGQARRCQMTRGHPPKKGLEMQLLSRHHGGRS